MRVLVLGAAVSGKAATRLARRLGHEVLVYDRREDAVAGLEAEGVAAASGVWRADHLDGVDLVVASPGFAQHAPPVQEALSAGIPLWSELELGSRQLKAGALVAITGTNGKTTVARMVGEMLRDSDLETVVAGNIGTALSEVVDRPWEVVVVEASSFQLRFVDTFHPRVAVLLNIAPDHLDWHGDLDAYTAAKQRIFARQGPEDVLVFDVDDPGAAGAVEEARSRRVPVSGLRRPPGGWGPEGDHLVLPTGRLETARLPRRDPSHLADLAAAGVAAAEAGASPEVVEEVAGRFRPSPHRREPVGTWRGVRWVNDSKATNPHAARAALAGLESVVLIAGGRNKGLDLRPLVEDPAVRRVVALGEAADELRSVDPERVRVAGSMEEAVLRAAGLAEPGDVVLLAPGCASFDMFSSYAERGEAFRRAVLALHGEEGS